MSRARTAWSWMLTSKCLFATHSFSRNEVSFKMPFMGANTKRKQKFVQIILSPFRCWEEQVVQHQMILLPACRPCPWKSCLMLLLWGLKIFLQEKKKKKSSSFPLSNRRMFTGEIFFLQLTGQECPHLGQMGSMAQPWSQLHPQQACDSVNHLCDVWWSSGQDQNTLPLPYI